MNRYILTTYNITDTITVNGYYTFTNIQINIVLDWFDKFTESYYITDTITLTLDNFSIVEVEYDIGCEKFIEKYGNPCNILEHIDDLFNVFNIIELDISSDDSDLYTGTEDVSRLIKAHMVGDKNTIKTLLLEKDFDDTDDIVNKIIENNRK